MPSTQLVYVVSLMWQCFFDLQGSSSGQRYNMHKCIYLIQLNTFILYNLIDIAMYIFKQICTTEILMLNTTTTVQVFPFVCRNNTSLKMAL